jgi:diadenosine tetraphosphatase ApaH/serine/threonine PP2A family protein phosphatase
MKVGILADIHGNLEALRSVLLALNGVSRYICAGDIVGYGPDPNGCVDIIRSLDCETVAGNNDLASVGRLDTALFNGEGAESIRWTSGILTDENRKFFEALPEHLETADYEIVHGSLRDPIGEYVTDIPIGAATIELMKSNICFVGHLHIPLVIVRDMEGNYDGWQLSDGDVIDTTKFDKLVINVGAVGQPRDMDKRASFGVFDTESKTIEIRKVEYDIAAVQKKMRKDDLPDFLIERLKYGR